MTRPIDASSPLSPSGPLSRRFDVAAVRDAATSFAVEATPDERDALARDCDLPGIDALSAAFRVRRDGSDGLHVTGTVTARLRQVCVVSLDEFASDLVEPVDVRFAPEAEVEELAAARAARPSGDDEELDDLPDPIHNGRIDLGALAAEILVLGLDPYPRKPGIVFDEPAAAAEPDESPFAALKAFKAADAPKPDAPKPDAPKPDAPKPDAPKPDAPKPGAPKPGAPEEPGEA